MPQKGSSHALPTQAATLMSLYRPTCLTPIMCIGYANLWLHQYFHCTLHIVLPMYSPPPLILIMLLSIPCTCMCYDHHIIQRHSNVYEQANHNTFYMVHSYLAMGNYYS